MTTRSRIRVLVGAFAAALLVSFAAAPTPEAEASPAGDPTAHFNWTEGLDLSYKDKNQFGGELGSGLDSHGNPIPAGIEEHEMSPPFVLLLMNFAIVLVILGWKAAPPIQRWVQDRHHTIKEQLEEAAKLRAEAQGKLDEYNAKLAAAEKEVDELIAGIREDAENEKKRILEQADAQAAAMKRDAEEQIAAEIQRAKGELEREVVAAAVAAAESILRQKTTAADHKKLVDGFIGEVEERA